MAAHSHIMFSNVLGQKLVQILCLHFTNLPVGFGCTEMLFLTKIFIFLYLCRVSVAVVAQSDSSSHHWTSQRRYFLKTLLIPRCKAGQQGGPTCCYSWLEGTGALDHAVLLPTCCCCEGPLAGWGAPAATVRGHLQGEGIQQPSLLFLAGANQGGNWGPLRALTHSRGFVFIFLFSFFFSMFLFFFKECGSFSNF